MRYIKCRYCKKLKKETDFYKTNLARCKKCIYEYQKQRYYNNEKDRTNRIARAKQRYFENKDEIYRKNRDRILNEEEKWREYKRLYYHRAKKIKKFTEEMINNE
jgi:hypothetical protein